nr:uncharacterized protein LOC111427622 isoform X1 [Onthophagus taurus]
MENVFSFWRVRELADKVTNVVMNYTDVEAKVREATNDEAWGPTGQIMQELAHSTFTYEHFPEVMSMLWKRMLQDNKQHWRRTYKSLLVLNYLIKNGSERVVTSAREHIYDLRTLENYTCIDELGKDQGINIRHKVRELIDFIQDDDKLREERKKAKKNKDKYIGMSSDMMTSGFSSERWDMFGERERDYENNSTSTTTTGRQYRDRSYDEDYENDENNSDLESNHNNRGGYRDAGFDSNSPRHQDKKVNVTLNPNIAKSPIKTPKQIKQVDLGAAANYAATNTNANFNNSTSNLSVQSPQPQSGSGDGLGDLLKDDFDPRAGESDSVTKNEDDFADFSSAFGPGGGINAGISNDLITQSDNLLGGVGNSSDIDLFSTAPNSSNIVIPSAINSGMTNSDLLGDLGFGGLSMQPPSQISGGFPNMNGNNLGGDNLMDNFKESVSIRFAASEVPWLKTYKEDLRNQQEQSVKSLSIITKSLIEDLINQKVTIFLQEDFNKKLNKFEEQFRLTKQFLGDIKSLSECPEYENYVTLLIPRFVEVSMERFVPIRWIFEEFNDRFIIEQTFLSVVTKMMKEIDGAKYFNIYKSDLKEIIKSKLFFETFLMYWIDCGEVDVVKEDLTLKYRDLAQIFVTLPTRICNLLKNGNFDEFFGADSFGKLVVRFFICLIAVSSRVNNINIDFERIAVLFDKIFVQYRNDCSKNLLLTLNYLSKNDVEVKHVLDQMFCCKISKSSLEYFLTTTLSLPIDVSNFLPIDMLKNSSCNYILCTKLPLLTNFTPKSNLFIYNLISLISKSSELLKLITHLLGIWGSKSSINRTSVEQHLFITKILIVSIKTWVEIGGDKEKLNDFKRQINSGIPTHLQSPIESVRSIGTITGDVVLNINNENDQKIILHHPKDNDEMLNELSQLKSVSGSLAVQEIDIKKVIDELKGLKEVNKNKVVDKNTTKIEETNSITAHTLNKKSSIIKIIDSNDFDLDSDDDLIPYDTSNDKKTQKDPPKFIYSLARHISTTNDPEYFITCIENAEEIIENQLKNVDVEIGLELLDVLINLSPRFYVENFQELIFKASIKIVSTTPKIYAPYLIKEFFSEPGNYSISNRVFILEIFVGAVQNLSASNKTKKGNSNSKSTELIESSQEIIRKRLESKTRRFKTSKPQIGTKNLFNEQAKHFFDPLINGLMTKTSPITLSVPQDGDYILLIQLLHSLAVITFNSHNCIIANTFGNKIFYVCWMLKYHKEPKVRTEVVKLLGAAIFAIPKSILMEEFLGQLFEIRSWLIERLSANVQRGEPNSECREVSEELLMMINWILKENSSIS